MAARHMALGVFLHAAGYHAAGWRHPQARSETEDIGHLSALCRLAEQGKFHLAFVADGLSTSRHAGPSVAARLEPLTLLSAIAVQTRHIGLAATVSTTFSEPYNVARQLASLDHISRGRAGWNIVTSSSEEAARNFGLGALPDPAQRYARGEEFVDVVRGLWDSWEDGAFLRDKAGGRYFDPGKLHPLDHQGRFFSVAGALNVSRTPQGRPLLIQAGSSEAGQNLAARVADLVFTAQPTLDQARAFRRALHERARLRFGRAASEVLVLPGVVPFIGRTRDEARQLYLGLQSRIDTGRAASVLSERFGVAFGEADLDRPVPAGLLREHLSSRVALLQGLAGRQGLTLRGLYRLMAETNGHLPLVGTAADVAQTLADWFRQGAADGFNVMPPYVPGALEDFVAQVVPLLQEQGLFHADYAPAGLRADLGLAIPRNRHTPEPAGEPA